MRRGVTLRAVGEKSLLWLKIVVLAVASLAPVFNFESASAAQLTSRKVTIGTSELAATDVQHIFSFSIPNTTATKAGIIYEFCTTPVGACTLPTNMIVESASHDAQSGWPDNGTAFTAVAADTGDCVITTNAYRACYSRDETVATGVTGGAVTHTLSNITAPDAAQTVYVRISIYSDNDFQNADLLDQGVVAEAFVTQLTVTGRVTERLQFCVAAFDDTDTVPTDCTTGWPTDTEVAIGTIDSTQVYRTPVTNTATNLANDRYGGFMVNTNASGGVQVTYFPEAQTNVSSGDTDQLRTFRVAPTDCSGTPTSLTDQCFDSADSTTPDDLSSLIGGSGERFGMSVACINTDSGSTDAFDPDGTGTLNTVYDGDGDDEDTGGDDCENEANNLFGFDDSGNPDDIVTSAGVVHDEFIKLQFGAIAAATTPEGSYSVVLTYIATPTF